MSDPKPPYVLALDIGTSSSRAMLFDREGEPVPEAHVQQPYHIPTRSDGAVEADPDALCEAVFSCIDACLGRAGSRTKEIAAVGACGFASSMVGVNQAGKAVSPVYTYADSRPVEDVLALRKEIDEGALHQRTGARLHTSYLAPRFRWLRREHPGILQSTQKWMALAEYLYLRIFGQTASSYSLASWSGLEDCRKLAWDAELLQAVGISPDSLLSLRDYSQPMRGLRGPFQSRWPDLADIPWFLPVGDGAAANIGSGCSTARQVAVTIGTTSAVRVVLPQPPEKIPYGLWCYRVDQNRALLGGALIEGGNLYAWLRQLFDFGAYPDLEKTLEGLPPDGHGLTFLPTVGGERNPGWNSNARGVISGLSLATKPVELLQAGLEGLACRVAQIYWLLRDVLEADPEVIASGGAVQESPYLHALLADVIGRPVALAKVEEASAGGVALLALESLGILNEVGDKPIEVGTVKQPEATRVEIYSKTRERVGDLYRRMYG